MNTEPPSAERVNESLLHILDEVRLCAWATVTRPDDAHINIGYFAYSPALELFLLSHPRSRHARNLVDNATMAVAVFSSSQNWTEPGRGVQLFGRGQDVNSTDAHEVERRYRERFPAYAEWRNTLPPNDRGREYRFYRFTPNHLKILDEPEFGDAVWIEALLEEEPYGRAT